MQTFYPDVSLPTFEKGETYMKTLVPLTCTVRMVCCVHHVPSQHAPQELVGVLLDINNVTQDKQMQTGMSLNSLTGLGR